MDKKTELKDMDNNTLYNVFEEYLKKTINEDLERIYGKKLYIVDSDEPWAFQLTE